MTDSVGGAIWRATRGHAFDRWVADPLLAPLSTDPFGRPLPGANGIAFFPPDTLYVANTEQGLIAKVSIQPDGSAGTVQAVTIPFAVPTVDGIAVDAHGDLYGALPGFALLGTPPLVKLDPAAGAVSAVPADATRFDTPVSLAFRGSRWGEKWLLVTNGDLPLGPGGPGPGVVAVDVNAPGVPVR